MKTYSARPSDIERQWFAVDATDKTLGRLAASIAQILQGKHKPMYTPSMDTGDHVIVVNAGKIRVTGNKLENKVYHRHSGYPGGLKTVKLSALLESKPERVIEYAVRGMLPKGTLGRMMLKKLKVYSDSEHPHSAQMPKTLEI